MKTNLLVEQLEKKAGHLDQELGKDKVNPHVVSSALQSVNTLVGKLDPVLGIHQIKKIVGVTVFGLLISSNSNNAWAQNFEGPKNAFNLPKGYYYSFLEIADLDADGDFDVLVGEYYGGLKFYKNKGTPEAPKFLVPEVNPFGFTSDSEIIIPRLVDIDGDGDLDLVTLENEGYFYLHKNVGTKEKPQFSLPEKILQNASIEENMSIPDFEDLDGDGRVDFVIKNEQQELGFYKNNKNQEDAYFDTSNFNVISTLDTLNISFQFVDVDQDGDLDITTTDGYSFYFQINSGNSQNFEIGAAVNAENKGLKGAQYVTNFRFVDIDNDGDLDLFYSQYIYGEIKFFENISE